MVLVKKWPFFHLFFLGNIGQENVFYNILESLSFHLEYQLKYISRLIFLEKQTMEKFIIFDQNRGLTPLEKFKICNIWPKSWSWKFNFFVNFLKSFFISLESLSFHLFWKPYNGKFPIFEENRWPSPLG